MNSTTHTLKTLRQRDRTDRAWFTTSRQETERVYFYKPGARTWLSILPKPTSLLCRRPIQTTAQTTNHSCIINSVNNFNKRWPR